MQFVDILFVLRWWLRFFVIGLMFLPLTIKIFSNFFDRGYIFARILGMALISYIVFALGILKILPFRETTIFLASGIFLFINIFILLKVPPLQRWNLLKSSWRIFAFEEVLFLATLFFWSFIRAHQPDIHGLEKYMDFGFINSIIRSDYFPPKDMWLTPHSINYYYFGHLVTAVLTKISAIPSSITYNLMLSTIFALTFTASFSIGANLIEKFKVQSSKFKVVLVGLLTGFLVSIAGNLHTIYAFFKPYENENPVPFWQLAFSPNSFPNAYWYPNATRFINNTIHEFPIYSSVVSDLHGHYLDVPFVLFTLAILLALFYRFSKQTEETQNSKLKTQNYNSKLKTFIFNSFAICDLRFAILLAFMLAIMYMTNAWDGIIYFGLAILVLLYVVPKIVTSDNLTSKTQNSIPDSIGEKTQNYNLKLKAFSFKLQLYALRFTLCATIIMAGFFIFSLPFNIYFRPFASGIGVLCAPEFLTNIGKLGPFLFEKDHCQHSPWWQLLILYGFFYFWAVSFIIYIKNQRSKIKNTDQKLKNFKNLDFIKNLNLSDLFTLLLIAFSTFLIIIPEFIYVKDIYPGHYRANTMFKLVYQSFIMLSIASGYIIVRIISKIKNKKSKIKNKIFNFYYVYLIFAILFFILVIIYPYFSINSYYEGLKIYRGLDGIAYLKTLYPTDYSAILWINKNIKEQPVILEAQGDSYTDYARISANTGLPTVLGWPVHEWLWRGTYDIPSPRIAEVQKMHESTDIKETKQLLKKYNVFLVFIGELEKQKYPNLNEDKFKTLGKIIYQNGNTKIYQLN